MDIIKVYKGNSRTIRSTKISNRHTDRNKSRRDSIKLGMSLHVIDKQKEACIKLSLYAVVKLLNFDFYMFIFIKNYCENKKIFIRIILSVSSNNLLNETIIFMNSCLLIWCDYTDFILFE